MEFTQLKYFYLAAKYEHFTKAANELHISQPALTKSIRQLEDELQTNLFQRVGRIVVLTESGKVLYSYVGELLAIERDLRNEIDAASRREEEKVNIIVRCLFSMIPGMIKGFIELYPRITVNLYQGNNEDLIKSNNYDLIISGSMDEMNNKNSLVLLTEPIDVCISSKHPLADRESVSIEELADTPYVGLTDNRILGKTIKDYFENVGFKPSTFVSCDDSATLSSLVKEQVGFTLISRYTFDVGDDSGLKMIPLSTDTLERKVYLTWRPRSYMTASVSRLKDFIVRYIKEYPFT